MGVLSCRPINIDFRFQHAIVRVMFLPRVKIAKERNPGREGGSSCS